MPGGFVLRRPAADYGPANTQPWTEQVAKLFMMGVKLFMFMGVLYVMPRMLHYSFNAGYSSQHSHDHPEMKHVAESAHRLY